MESIIKELWHGNIIPQEDSRTNSKEMKELLGYMARHTHSEGILPSEQMQLTLAQSGTVTTTKDANGKRSSKRPSPMSRKKSSRITCSKLKTTECCF
jgi:hypothetical protein